jgi:hypothetical protein
MGVFIVSVKKRVPIAKEYSRISFKFEIKSN